jgi:acetyltransferase-like isoleucine patch superfamily enzyme
MNRFFKRLLGSSVSPLIRAIRPAIELVERFTAYVLLCSRIRTPVDPSVVVLQAPQVHGTARITLGRNLRLYTDLYFETQEAGTIEIGDDVVISRGTQIVAFNRITIGAGTMIGEYTSIRDADHLRGSDGLIRETGSDSSPISIGERVWVGRGVMILPGVHIGDRATIGANAVVTRDVPPDVVAVGIPARVVNKRVLKD